MLAKKDSMVYAGIVKKTSSNWDGYGFKLENVEKITPIEINGKLSLWDYDYEKETNKSAISNKNALNYQYVDAQTKIESTINE